jgi:cation:H+ antiporter
MIILYILIFIVSCLLLIKSGTWTVQSLTRIAKSLEWKEFILAFILMAFVTSLPEFFVGISSALHNRPELSFGNIIGSNIINLTLAIAIVILLSKKLKCGTKLIQRNSLYTALIAFLPIVLMLGDEISRIDGIILLIVLFVYIKFLFKEQAKYQNVFVNKFKRNWTEFKLFLKDLAMLFGGIALLLISAEAVVWSILTLSESLNLSLMVVGSLIVALGTNLPEIVFGLKAIAMGHKEMVLGALMGSVVANSTLVLGTTVLISPLYISEYAPYIIGILFTIITCLFFAIFSRTEKEITEKEALVLFVVYFLFVFSQLVIK